MLDLTGQQFRRLKALNKRKVYINNISTIIYDCICDCGNKTEVTSSNLKSGKTSSCGCLQKELLSKKTKKPLHTATKRSILNYYKRNAKLRNYEFELTEEQFCKLILDRCNYCGHEGRTKTIMKHGDWLIHNGIDRINNKLGYTLDNSITCCKICNLAKNNLTEEEFKNWIKEVYDHLFLK